MAAPRTAFRRESDRAIVAEMYLERRTIDEIATHLTINRKTVMADLRVIEQRWFEASDRLTSARKAEELARIDRIELTAWEGYYRSNTVREVTKTVLETEGGEMVTKTKAETRKEELVGDPRWLDKVCWCVEQRAKILGLYAPAKSEGRYQHEHEHHLTVQTERDREFARLLEQLDPRGTDLSPCPDEALPRGFGEPG